MSLYDEVKKRAHTIAEWNGLKNALESGRIRQFQNVSLSETLILGLLNQGVSKYIGILGHGNTDFANILSHYENEGLVQFFNVRHATEAAHCVTMLKWRYGETAAVLTSIGPGALHAFAGSLVSASNGIGVYHIYGDETTQDEGPNMQQLPSNEQGGFLKMVETMGRGYLLHTPEAVFTALRRGASTVFNPDQAGPFFFLLPMNIQPKLITDCNLAEIPEKPVFPRTVCTDTTVFEQAAQLVREAEAITIKFGGGAVSSRGTDTKTIKSNQCGAAIEELAEMIDAVIVSGAKMSGIVPFSSPRFMSVGGSKGSLCGNYAMENADLIIVVGARAVCQWDCSGTAFKNARNIINFNTRSEDAFHYNRSVVITGDAASNLRAFIGYLRENGFSKSGREGSVRGSETGDGGAGSASHWLAENAARKKEWLRFKKERYDDPVFYDEGWNKEVLTQPAAIKIAYDFAREKNAARYFDAGDVQANGFQIVEDESYGMTVSDTGASYMGFAVSALLSGALADRKEYAFAFTGDGSFTMNPQILFDGVEHGLRACIILFDNRSMGAITGLQRDQYEEEYRTGDRVETDYVALVNSVKGVFGIEGGTGPEQFRGSLEKAYAYKGLSVVHVPVYSGSNPLGGLGVFGSWNVGNWCDDVQQEHHRIGL